MPVSGARRGSSAAARCRVEERALIAAGVSGPLVVRDADLRRPLTAAALAVVPGEAHVVHPAVEVPRALGADLRAVSLPMPDASGHVSPSPRPLIGSSCRIPVTTMRRGSPSGSVMPRTDTVTYLWFGGQSSVGFTQAWLQSGGASHFPFQHALPLPHGVPSGASDTVHPPVLALHAATWQASGAVQVTGFPLHAPAWHASPQVQRLPSSQLMPSAF